MTFSIVVPNAAQSPGLFPSQNNTNFQRLKDIINNDHNFTDSASASQGIHKQATFINRSTPVGLPAGNGVLYSQADGTGASQLHWYNGASDVTITPGTPTIVGTANLGPLATTTIFADPGYPYQLYFWTGITGVGANSSGTAFHYSNNVNGVGAAQGAAVIKLSYSGNNIIAQNILTTGSPIPLTWTLQIIRLS